MRRLLALSFFLAAPLLAQPYYRMSMEPVFNPMNLTACTPGNHDAIFYDAGAGTLIRCNESWANAIPGQVGPQGPEGPEGPQGASGTPGPTCVSFVLWSACSPTGITNCTIVGAGCATVTNVAAVGARGAVVALDMDTFSHCRLRYAGAMAAAQTGTVTVKLRSYSDGAGTDWIATTFNSGLACADRSSAIADLSAKTGLHWTGLHLGNSAATDDPLLSAVTLTCCNQTFTW
jgi:hypothetical protein